MNYFSLFSGIGGFEYGLEQAYIRRSSGDSQTPQSTSPVPSLENSQSHLGRLGDNACTNPRPPTICVGFSEIDRYAIQIYRKHFPNHKEYGNVTNIKCSDVPDFELLCGGFPCQSFSIAGKRGGFSDTRGTLFFEIARIAQEKQPRLLLLENVKGLLSHDKGRTFGTILRTMDELGYDLQWQVLNSKNFAVPQNRERVFIIGHLRTTPRPQIFPLLRSSEWTSERSGETPVIRTLTGGGHSGGHHSTMTLIKEMKVANAVTPDAYLATGKRKRVDGKAVLTSMHERRIRRLTPTECERLQGFPDGWTEKGIDIKGNETLISDSQRYRCLGNAVTTTVISAIMEKLLDSLQRIC